MVCLLAVRYWTQGNAAVEPMGFSAIFEDARLLTLSEVTTRGLN
jgi:hypothetical protein